MLPAAAVLLPPTLTPLTASSSDFMCDSSSTMLTAVAVPVNMTGCTVDPRANGLYVPTFNLYTATTVDYYTLGTCPIATRSEHCG